MSRNPQSDLLRQQCHLANGDSQQVVKSYQNNCKLLKSSKDGLCFGERSETNVRFTRRHIAGDFSVPATKGVVHDWQV